MEIIERIVRLLALILVALFVFIVTADLVSLAGGIAPPVVSAALQYLRTAALLIIMFIVVAFVAVFVASRRA